MTILNQGPDAHIRDRGVGQKDTGQREAILNQCRDALIRDRRVGKQGRWTASTNTEPRP